MSAIISLRLLTVLDKYLFVFHHRDPEVDLRIWIRGERNITDAWSPVENQTQACTNGLSYLELVTDLLGNFKRIRTITNSKPVVELLLK